MALAKSLHNCLEEQKKKGVKRGAKLATEKLAMGEGRYLKGEHIGMVWCTGAQGDGQEEEKMKKVIIMVLGEIDPAPLWKQI